jgi:hypothetical protein
LAYNFSGQIDDQISEWLIPRQSSPNQRLNFGESDLQLHAHCGKRRVLSYDFKPYHSQLDFKTLDWRRAAGLLSHPSNLAKLASLAGFRRLHPLRSQSQQFVNPRYNSS